MGQPPGSCHSQDFHVGETVTITNGTTVLGTGTLGPCENTIGMSMPGVGAVGSPTFAFTLTDAPVTTNMQIRIGTHNWTLTLKDAASYGFDITVAPGSSSGGGPRGNGAILNPGGAFGTGGCVNLPGIC